MDQQETRFLQIGDLAKEARITLRTVRYYEEMGLMEPSGRSSGGLRLYTRQDLARLRFLRRLKALDFSIEEMKHLVGKTASAEPTQERVQRTRQVLEAERSRVERKVAELERLRQEIGEAEAYVEECASCTLTTCPATCRNQDYLLPS